MCALCIFFFSFLFFFVCHSFLNSFSFCSSLRSSQQMRPFFPIVHTLLATGSFFSPLFFLLYMFFLLCSVTLSTLLFTVVLFFFSLYICDSVLLRTFFFLSPFPFFLIDCSASQPFSPCLSRRHHSVFSPCDFGARFCVCATLMMCFA